MEYVENVMNLARYQSCNVKRFKDNFRNWTSGNKDIDEFIKQSQLDAVHYFKYLEWIPFENFQDVTYIAQGGFGKVYSAVWLEGYILYWDIENQQWIRYSKGKKFALKSLDNSSNISSDFLNEVIKIYSLMLKNLLFEFYLLMNFLFIFLTLILG